MAQIIKSILLIDDCSEVICLVKHALKGFANIDTAETISQAKLMLNCCDFDLIVLDVSLPDGNGFDLCKELKTNSFLKSIPIVMLTAKNKIDDKIRGFTLGCNDYITKPFDLREVKARIESKLNEFDLKKLA